MSIVILDVDLGKNACSVVGVDAAGAVIVRKSMRRQTLIDYVTKLPACVIAMEACCGAHYLGRLFAAQGARNQIDVAGERTPVCQSAEE